MERRKSSRLQKEHFKQGRKKKYAPPELIKYGSIAKLTAKKDSTTIGDVDPGSGPSS